MNSNLIVKYPSKRSVILKYNKELHKMSAAMFNKIREFFLQKEVVQPTQWNVELDRGFLKTDVIEIQKGVDIVTCSVLSNTGLDTVNIGLFCKRLTVDLGDYCYDKYRTDQLYGLGLLNLLVVCKADKTSLYTFAKSIADSMYMYVAEWFYLDLDSESAREKTQEDIYALVCLALYYELNV